MKTLHTIAAIAVTLFSTAALAEQGSGEFNQVVHPTSAAHYTSNDLNMAQDELTAVNGDAAKNEVAQPTTHEQHSVADRHMAPADLTSLNS